MPNLFADIPDDLPEELIQGLAAKNNVRIERIVSRGHASPNGFWYDQPNDEFVLLLSGEATLEFDHDPTDAAQNTQKADRMEMKPGDYRVIPAHTRHRVASTTPDTESVWLAVHF